VTARQMVLAAILACAAIPGCGQKASAERTESYWTAVRATIETTARRPSRDQIEAAKVKIQDLPTEGVDPELLAFAREYGMGLDEALLLLERAEEAGRVGRGLDYAERSVQSKPSRPLKDRAKELLLGAVFI
jgi:hypothetical protein